MPKILVVGPGRCGKDASLLIVERLTGLKSAGTFSRYLAKYVAKELGVDEAAAYAERHRHRETWFRVGNSIRTHDPAMLCREAFAHGDLSGGARALPEIRAIHDGGLADLIVWIDRDVPPDPTLEFGPEWADVIIPNHGSLGELEDRWCRVLRFGRLLR